MRPIDYTHEISGKRYFTVKHFALVTMRSETNVRHLMRVGNRLRCLRVFRIAEKPMIPYEELMEFPFTLPGRCERVYHYTEKGVPTQEELVS